jgi:hypothetical protein
MKRKFTGIVGSLLDLDRIKSLEGTHACRHCGWGCDDPELDVCCDCFDAITMKQMLRGEWGKAEQEEARASMSD